MIEPRASDCIQDCALDQLKEILSHHLVKIVLVYGTTSPLRIELPIGRPPSR